jgi:hypothetical protein
MKRIKNNKSVLNKMEPEVYFLKFAFCGKCLEKATREEYKTLEDAAINDKVLPRSFLERIFNQAFEFMNIVANDLNKDIWSNDVIDAYFLEYHNRFITEGRGIYKSAQPFQKDFCSIHTGVVVKKEGEFLIVSYREGKKTRAVCNSFVLDADIGDKVIIHHEYAVKKI